DDVVKFRNQVTEGRGEDNRKARGGRGAASKTLGLLSVIFSRAIKEKYITVNPVVGVRRPKDRKLERFLTLEEFTRLGNALALAEKNKSETEYVIAAIRLLIFTGCRRSEILKLQWAQVDTQRAMLFLTDSKTGPKPVYLSAPALDILKNLTKEAKNPYVICGTKKAYHADITRPWERIKKKAGLTDVRLHDLRHSYASIGASGGVPLQIIGKLLGHANTSTTERYAHLAADPIRAANEAMAKTIQEALTGKPDQTN
ncbi:MAG: site-specific integrase, partial [Proteobacteria bacterium]|nr:site-specific integrase [Pseudomonadota bacterium]